MNVDTDLEVLKSKDVENPDPRELATCGGSPKKEKTINYEVIN